MIVGPDPADLTDEELMRACEVLNLLGQLVAGTPGVPVTSMTLDALEPSRRWLCDALYAVQCVLLAENERRVSEDVSVLLAEVDRFIGGDA